MQHIVIIGAMAAGCKTSARLKRVMPDAEVTLIDKRNFISYGSCGMPFYAAGDVNDFFDLAKTSYGRVRDKEFFANIKDVNVLTDTEVQSVNHDNQTIECLNLLTKEVQTIKYTSLVFATGASSTKPFFPCPEHEIISSFHNPLDAKHFRQRAQKGQIGKVAIVGAGYIGTELAEAMVGMWGFETHLIELEAHLLPKNIDPEISSFLEKTYTDNDVNLHLSTEVKKIQVLDSNEAQITFSSGEALVVDHVFLCLGVKPNIELAKEIGITISSTGAIKVDRNQRTNFKDIYAAGDCTATRNIVTGRNEFFPLGSLANRQGRVIANNIAGKDSEFKGAAGTISVKVFDQITAATGLSEKSAKKFGFQTRSLCYNAYDRPDYHPDHQPINVKMVYELHTLKLLGLQITGTGEVTRYIDVFSNMLANKASAEDLLDFEHAYTPSHSSPINPLNVLGAMAIAQDQDQLINLKPNEIDSFGGYILDVREEEEIKQLPFHKNAIHFKMDKFRENIKNYKHTDNILLVCQRGPRSFEVARGFINAGFTKVSYLGGGVRFFNKTLS